MESQNKENLNHRTISTRGVFFYFRMMKSHKKYNKFITIEKLDKFCVDSRSGLLKYLSWVISMRF